MKNQEGFLTEPSLERKRKTEDVVSPEEVEAVPSVEALANQAHEAEREVANDVKQSVSDWVRSSKPDRLPSWVKSGLLMTQLFAAETAIAEELAEQAGMELAVQSQAEVMEQYHLRHAKEQLKPYLEGSAVVITLDDGTFKHLSQDFIDGTEAVPVFEGVITNIQLHRELEASAMPTQSTSHDLLVGILDNGTKYAAIDWIDSVGNSMYTYWMMEKDATDCSEYTTVTPAIEFADSVNEPAIKSLELDLRPIGGTIIYSAFKYKQPASIGEVRGRGVYASGLGAEEASQLMDTYGEHIMRGVSSMDELYGYSQATRIVFLEDEEANAAYYGNPSTGLVYLNTGLFEHPATETSSVFERVEETVEHEEAHGRDHQNGYSKDETVKLLFASASPKTLSELGEAIFSGGFGGHPQENEREFIASVLNTLDDPDWEEHASRLSPEAQRVYLGVLQAMVAVHEAHSEYRRPTGTLNAVLAEKIEYLESIYLVEKP